MGKLTYLAIQDTRQISALGLIVGDHVEVGIFGVEYT